MHNKSHLGKDLITQKDGGYLRTPFWLCKTNKAKCTTLFFEWNLIRLGSPAHGIVTKTLHKTLPGNGGRRGQGGRGGRVGGCGVKG